MVCKKKTRILWRRNVGYIDTVLHARDYKVKYVVAHARVGFLLSCVKSGRP